MTNSMDPDQTAPKLVEKEIKCEASLAFYLSSVTGLINSIKHEHSCKILYIQVTECKRVTMKAGIHG